MLIIRVSDIVEAVRCAKHLNALRRILDNLAEFVYGLGLSDVPCSELNVVRPISMVDWAASLGQLTELEGGCGEKTGLQEGSLHDKDY